MSRARAVGTAVLASALSLGGCTALFSFDRGAGTGGDSDAAADHDGVDAGPGDAGACGQVLATYATPGAPIAAAVVRNRVVVSWQGGGVDLVDAADARHPRRLDSQTLIGPSGDLAVSDCAACAVTEGGRTQARAFVAGAGGVEAYLPDTELATVGRLRVASGGVAVAADHDGTRILVALGDGRLAFADVATLGDEPGATRALSETTAAPALPCAPSSIALLEHGRAAALIDETSGCDPELWLLDDGVVEHVVSIDGGASQIVALGADALLLAGGSAGLQHVSLGGDEPLVEPIPVQRAVRAAAALGGAVLAVGAGALVVLDLSSPLQPTVIAQVELPAEPRSVAASGQLAFVAGEHGLAIVDVGCFLPAPTLDDGRDGEPVQ